MFTSRAATILGRAAQQQVKAVRHHTAGPPLHKVTKVERGMMFTGVFCAFFPVPVWVLMHLPEYRGEV